MARQKRKFNDLGLGTKNDVGGYRALNKDGSFNVRKINVPFFERLNFFHTLITMSWTRFFGFVLLCYFIINTFFAIIYTFIGVENLTGIDADSSFDQFMEGFFFSAQTITTLGYGRVAPIGYPANIVAAIESMMGLLGFALATGLLYGRFSRPSSKIRYSTHAVIAPYQDINGFMFRITNPQGNQLLEMEVQINLAMQRKDSELRDFFSLELERSSVAFMPYMWTIVHPITDKSPLHNMDKGEILKKDAEFIIATKAFDESSAQTVYSRSSYKADEIKWGEKFIYAVKREHNGLTIDVGKIDSTEKAKLNS
ncbi:ion channel [Flagellimonas flava]|uniref:Inward rectifier potassium channel n=1 Tax=Flagellimonas flava TaxID=570519 RepID=A0A1M5N3X1_9FLAO|nr:ion channel [Allomuricauda flava]SHG83693.1 inward rectifier potassium channel [Allomuricauda flava]